MSALVLLALGGLLGVVIGVGVACWWDDRIERRLDERYPDWCGKCGRDLDGAA